ncbi:phosphoenolpyruvate carboxykinase (ATP) [Fimbriimonas ginsengisoli]|uniref:Phosphoenolpyruvate carboxykinase (ATP) n=1 Tax=Fimbriimonas ginsengisoli Gsoil 348 TaxID=661478 RepID=A0A068NNW4_FIMGI|nr:phosphoenolpyruvate carboxykinase (ATP) [Fimbriimonas ginsengisoli]AIE85258.1 phosphoenolpyruvate carboxykinase [Fimbriimonas ginsengisoli Gsoil 348]
MSSSTTTLTMPIDLQRAEAVYNPSVETLISDCLAVDECKMASSGAVVAYTGKYTGRTPKDKHIVREPGCENNIWWENTAPMSPDTFAKIGNLFAEYAVGRKLYVIDTFGGADPDHRIAARFIVERPYHALFIKQLLIRPTAEELAKFEPDWTIVDFGKRKMDPATEGTKGDAVIALNFAEKQVLIGGTEYAGEMKKSVFTIMNYLLPLEGVLSMHCSANIGQEGDTALFFGLSGTGKTTLSADPERRLIGDDEHGWTDKGVFNIEGGCYAKCIKLSEEGEPEIFHAIRRGAVLENVVLRPDGTPDYNDDSLTENTRAAYPIEHIENAVLPSMGGHPKNIVFLTADAMGVLPPIARLTPEQAMYYFLNGYTAKVAGTEAGIKEPQAVFSTCFGAPFLPLHPKAYADLLKEKIERHGAKVWLVNTGWTGGPYGVGERMKLRYTRAMLKAAFEGELDEVPYDIDPIFGLHLPTSCPGVPTEVLQPRGTWADPAAYDAKANELKSMFEANIAKFT